jgi:hypothetical protein
MLKDYVKESEYFDPKDIQTDIKSVEKTKKTVIWMQEFSKRVVSTIFLVYVGVTLYTSIMIYLAMQATGDASMVSLLLTETNSTFRDVVGGYIIKAAVENAFKIGGNYYVGVADAKLKALKERLGVEKEAQLEPEMQEDVNVEA